MNDLVKKWYSKNNDIWGFPQTYKGIKLYPLKLVDGKYHELFYRLFAYPKNSIKDKTILKMSYLKFIIFSNYSSDAEDNCLLDFLEHITKTKNIKIESKLNDPQKGLDSNNLVIRILIDGIEISEYEFDEMREIILEQNGLSIEYVEEYHPDLEQKLALLEGGNLSFEDEVFTFSMLTNKTLAEISEYTLYQMQNLMERYSTMKHFELYKPLEVSGQITLKTGEIRPYFYHRQKRGRYDSILISKNDFVEKNKDLFGNS